MLAILDSTIELVILSEERSDESKDLYPRREPSDPRHISG
jgi:hypothetical protein